MLQQEGNLQAHRTPPHLPGQQKFFRTQQRFCKRIGGNYYLVQVIQTSQCNTCVSYFDGRTGAKVFTKQLHKRWLQALSPSVRNVLLTKSKWFRDHAENILSSAACTPSQKPTRKPPPIPHASGRKRSAVRSLNAQFSRDAAGGEEQRIKALLSKVSQLEAQLRRQHGESGCSGEMKDKLSEAESLVQQKEEELEKKNEELAEVNMLLEKTVEECEGICSELQAQFAKDLKTVQLELSQEMSKSKLLLSASEKHKAEAKAAQEEAQVAASILEKSQLECQSLSQSLRKSQEQLKAERKFFEDKQKELELQLNSMTESKNANKRYGAELKQKMLDLSKQAEDRILLLANNCKKQTTELEEKRSSLHMAEKRFRESEAELKKVQGVNMTLKEELDKFKLELQALQHAKVSLENRLKVASDKALGSEAELDKLKRVHRQEREELEQQLNSLKVQLFDVREENKKKKLEVEELTGYVTNLLDNVDSKK